MNWTEWERLFFDPALDLEAQDDETLARLLVVGQILSHRESVKLQEAEERLDEAEEDYSVFYTDFLQAVDDDPLEAVSMMPALRRHHAQQDAWTAELVAMRIARKDIEQKSNAARRALGFHKVPGHGPVPTQPQPPALSLDDEAYVLALGEFRRKSEAVQAFWEEHQDLARERNAALERLVERVREEMDSIARGSNRSQ